MNSRDRDYIFHSVTESLCPVCLSKIPAKIIERANQIFLLKTCPTHGETTCLLEEDAAYYLARTAFDKPGTISKTQTQMNKGCPFDCGLCPDHEQHTCIAVIEITDHCNLHCPVCYANGGASGNNFLDLTRIADMLDLYRDSEYGEAEVLQISGGEPTTHPDVLKVIELARLKKIRYVMLNTNGLRLAEDLEFVKALSQFDTGFEIYLQFDGFAEKTQRHFIGKNVSDLKKKAIENLAQYHIPLTLVARVERGVNDHEIGQIVAFGLETGGVRGVNFQPVTFFGRVRQACGRERITLTGVLGELERQTSGAIKKSDFIPLPCSVDRMAINYLYRQGESWVPIARAVNIRDYLSFIGNTVAFESKELAVKTIQGALRGEACRCTGLFKEALPLVTRALSAKKRAEGLDLAKDTTFRISVSSFLDAYNFDTKAMKKECAHIITPDLKKIPFSAYNLLYRNGHRKG